MPLPGFTADLSVSLGRSNPYTRRGVFSPSAGLVAPQVSIHKLCCPSGDCDTTTCINDDGAHVTCTNGKANTSCNSCFLTSACAVAQNLPDDCDELRILRTFRDTYLLATAPGRALVQEYYKIAPGICARIDLRQDAKLLYADLYRRLVLPTVRLVQAGQFGAACDHYRLTTLDLERSLLAS